MDRDSVNRLRFDRRLQHRRDWVEDGANDAHLESLPDVSDKMTRGLDDPEDQEVASNELTSSSPAETDASSSFSPPEPSSASTPGSTTDSFGGGGFGGGGTELS